jgi:hypothetical protein
LPSMLRAASGTRPSWIVSKNSAASGQVRVMSGDRAGLRSNRTLPRSSTIVHSKFQSSSTQRVSRRATRMCCRTERSRPVRTKACWMRRRAARFEMGGRSGTFKLETIAERGAKCGVSACFSPMSKPCHNPARSDVESFRVYTTCLPGG